MRRILLIIVIGLLLALLALFFLFIGSAHSKGIVETLAHAETLATLTSLS